MTYKRFKQYVLVQKVRQKARMKSNLGNQEFIFNYIYK